MNSVKKSIIFAILSVVLLVSVSQSATLLPVIDISGGERHTLVLGQNGQAFACGNNSFSQLGLGDYPPQDTSTLFRVHGPNNIYFLDGICDVEAGWKHSLALDVNSMVWAWGKNGAGQLGNGKSGTFEIETTPVQVLSGQQDTTDPNSPLKYIIDISAGRSGIHSLAVDANGFCWSWGYNFYGQLGSGNYIITNPVPVEVNDTNNTGRLENIIAVSAGSYHSMALDDDGFVWTFGDNEFGKLGVGDTQDRETPVKVHGVNDVNFLENIVAISAGWDHCMALEGYSIEDFNICGKVYSWGNNGTGNYGEDGGRLGNGQVTGSNSTPVIVLSGQQDSNSTYLKNIVEISAGESHSMALGRDGFVYTWGDNGDSQLGTGDNSDYNTPVKVIAPDRDGDGYSDDLDGDPNTVDYLGDDVPIAAISAGYWHCLAIDQQGRLYTWGMGWEGQLGLGNQNDYNIPKMIQLYYPTVHNLTKGIDYYEIQTAIDNADTNDIIEAETGTYEEKVDFDNKTLILQSTNPYNWGTVANTIIDGDGSDVVKFSDNTGSILTGFTITNGGNGIYCSGSQVTIEHCIIKENSSNGIYSSSHSPVIVNSIIHHNEDHGIYIYNTNSSVQPIIKNNWIHHNGTDGSGYGLYLYSMDSEAIVRNNTIADNNDYGINLSGTAADINSCIIWNNNSGGANLYGVSSVDYCCINSDPGGTGNITSDPCLADVDANNLHISPGSPCIDAADPCNNPLDETDIDGEDRVINDRVDIGADEFYWSKTDYNKSGYVDFIDYAMFASSWQTEDANVTLDDDNDVDNDDLALFCQDWLWEAPWVGTYQMMMSMGGGELESMGMESVSIDSIKLQRPQPIWLTRQSTAVSQETIENILDWLDEIWLNGEIDWTEEKFLEFRKAIEDSLQ